MQRLILRTVLAAVFAAAAAKADLPKKYHLALIQVEYLGSPAAYTKPQLLTAAAEMNDYYSQISYGNFNLDITVSTVFVGPFGGGTKDFFFTFDTDGNASPTPSNEAVVEFAANLAREIDHVDFSHIDGIAVLNSFPASADYMAGTVTVPSSSPVAGTYETAYLFERAPDSRLSPPGVSGVFWGPWAHEIGHMLEQRSGTVLGGSWNGHPSSYADGYALMDSSYPSSPSAYSVLGTHLMMGDKRVFNGWLPDGNVWLATGDYNDVLLAPLSDHLVACRACPLGAAQVIKAPITEGVYYLVEARAHSGIDTLPTTLSRRGVWDEGVHITRVDESADPPVRVINACDSTVPGGCVSTATDPRLVNCGAPQTFSVDTLPPYCWPFPLFHVGDTFNGEAGIQISVAGRTGNRFRVIVTRGFGRFMAPDVEVLRRAPFDPGLGFNVSGLPRHQLWIDSSCNGYASDIGPAGLRFGDPAQAQGLAVGDDLCLGRENRIYARIANRGTAPATGIRVHFSVSDPTTGQGFVEVGIADAQHFPALAFLAPGAQATVYVPYTPPGSLNGPLFSTPALAVRVDPLQGELSIGDNVASSNFARVQAIIGMSPDVPLRGPDLVYANGPNPATVFLNAIGNLPRGITLSTGQTPTRLPLTQGQQVDVPIIFAVSGKADAAAGQYAANVTLSGFVPLTNPVFSDEHGDYKTVAAQTVGIDVVQPSQIDLQVVIAGDLASVVQVNGRLQPNRKNEVVALDYTNPNQAPSTLLVQTGGDGKFQAQLITLPGTPVRAVYSGNQTYAPAATGRVVPGQAGKKGDQDNE